VQVNIYFRKMPVEAYPVIPMLNYEVFAVDRIFPGLRDNPLPGGINRSTQGGCQIQPLVKPEVPRDGVDPGAEGTGYPVVPQGKTKPPV
jgi:hypothetical protein